MSNFTGELLAKHSIKPEDVYLPAGGVAVFGRTGTGKSTAFFHSKFIKRVLIADTGSMAHTLWARDMATIIDPGAKESPIDQVRKEIDSHKDGILLLDSFTTLQEAQCAWWKKDKKAAFIPLPKHQEIVGNFRDLVLVLARAQTFTIFNTSPGGRGKTPTGEEVVYPAGCITGYPSLNGTNANSETILSRWGSVWGVFQGYKEIPRGLYVPGKDIRPESHAGYAPLKDPCGVVRDTTDGKGIMGFPERDVQENAGRCFVDELIVEATAKWPKVKKADPTVQPAKDGKK